MSLIEESNDFVSGFEACDAGSDGFDGTGTIGAGHNSIFDAEGVLALFEVKLWRTIM